MGFEHDAIRLFAGAFAVLVVASLAGAVLQRRTGGGDGSATVANLVARINAWWVMIGVLALAFLAGEIGVLVVFAFASFMALREFMTVTPTRRSDHIALFASFFVILPAQYYLIATSWYGLYSIFIPVYAFLSLPVLAALRGDVSRYMERVAEVQWGLMTTVYCLSHVPALATLDIPGYQGRELLLVAFLIIVVQGSDVLQYVWGKLLGRHKVAPRLSPSKTWEGFVGGVASATALGAAIAWITPFSLLQAAGIALVIAICGFFGGLVMSAIKRDRGVKDWGQMIEGHGGMLDRTDSLVFAAPIFFHMTRYWFTV
ncbi:MAG: phosphatidate cytidylyltransferase [Pseudomonadota bacterium]